MLHLRGEIEMCCSLKVVGVMKMNTHKQKREVYWDKKLNVYIGQFPNKSGEMTDRGSREQTMPPIWSQPVVTR